MNEQLNQEIAALEHQRSIFAADLANTQDETTKTALQAEIDAVDAKLAAKNAEAAQIQQQVEEKVAEATAQVTSSFDSISFDGQTVTLSELAANEPARQILQIYILQMVAEKTEQAEREKALLTSQLNESEEKREKIHADYDLLIENMNELRKQHAVEASNLKLELEDMTARRDAAATELTEAKAEIERLNSQVDDLRTEIAVGAKAAVNVTNMGGGNLGELMKQFQASKPAIYDIQPLDNKRSQYSAKLATDDSDITFNYLEKGKYREVTAEEAAEIAGRFRAEQAANTPTETEPATTSETDVIPDSPLGGDLTPPQVPPIQAEETAIDGLVGDSAVSQSNEQGVVTREEFEALKRDVEALKQASAEVAA